MLRNEKQTLANVNKFLRNKLELSSAKLSSLSWGWVEIELGWGWAGLELKLSWNWAWAWQVFELLGMAN